MSGPEFLVPRWLPGGDVKVMTVEVSSTAGLDHRWSAPRVVLQEADGNIPKVIGNPPLVVPLLGGGEHWVLPYWRERPRGRTQDLACQPDAPAYSGTLVSADRGVTWRPYGAVEHTHKVRGAVS